MRVILLLLTLMASGCAADDDALASHLSRTVEAGALACPQLTWPRTTATVAPLPEADRVVTLAHDDGLAACGFGTYTPEDPGDAPQQPVPAAVVVVTDGHPQEQAFDGTTMAGREVLYRSTSLEELGLHGDVRVTAKTLVVGDHALTAAVTTGHTSQVGAGDLLDAAAADLGL